MTTALKDLRIDYRAPADACATGLSDASVDVCHSYAVLEHVPLDVVAGLVSKARRVLKPSGVFYALIGLHDHFHNFVSKVNFLKYPEWAWGALVKNRISYHNRLRERGFLRLLTANGAYLVDVKSTTYPADLRQVGEMRVDVC